MHFTAPCSHVGSTVTLKLVFLGGDVCYFIWCYWKPAHSLALENTHCQGGKGSPSRQLHHARSVPWSAPACPWMLSLLIARSAFFDSELGKLVADVNSIEQRKVQCYACMKGGSFLHTACLIFAYCNWNALQSRKPPVLKGTVLAFCYISSPYHCNAGEWWIGGQRRRGVLFVQKGVWFLSARETPRCFQSGSSSGPFWSWSQFLFAKLHFQEVSSIENPFQMPKQALEEG